MSDYRPGDRLLTLRDEFYSRVVAWWTHSEWSHCTPILDELGTTLEARLPRIGYGSVDDYAGATVLHLRPAEALTEAQMAAWVAAGEVLRGRRYDLLSLAGFIFGNGLQHKSKPNCAELLLTMDHAAGLLLGRGDHLVTPQSYAEFAAAGLFTVVSDVTCA